MNKENTIRDWALAQLGSPYVYGATGSACTPAQRQARLMQYPMYAADITAACPRLSGKQGKCDGCAYQGKLCFDCAQFVRKAFEQAGIRLPSGASSQWQAKLWQKKGEYSPEAKERVCAVFASSGDIDKPMRHVGLSLGDGRVMDARSHKRGVVISPMAYYPWTHYALVNLNDGLMDEENDEVNQDMEDNRQIGETRPALLPGDKGEAVKSLQRLLCAKGFPLPRFGVDGQLGKETLRALHKAQISLGLPIADGADEAFLQALRMAVLDTTAPSPLDSIREKLDKIAADVTMLKLELEGMKG